MRPRNPRFISICDQFSFFVTHHIPNPLSSGFEFPFHQTVGTGLFPPLSADLLFSAWNVTPPLFLVPWDGSYSSFQTENITFFGKVSFIHR